MKTIELPLLEKMQNALAARPPCDIAPFKDANPCGNKDAIAIGQEVISKGKVACLIVAGGMGSRLDWQGPKGTFPISCIKHKSLFQLFAEKIKAATDLAGTPLKLAIMTSPINHQLTISFFQTHNFFGLKDEQVYFFQQEELPFLTEEGLPIEEGGALACGPDGNGRALSHLLSSGIASEWKKSGIEAVTFVQIDNPLIDPFDAELIGTTFIKQADVAIKTIRRTDSKEPVGTLALIDGNLQVVEYSEMPEKMQSIDTYPYANISNFCFSLSFIERAARRDAELPLHPARKIMQGKPVVKFEAFIFDTLVYAKKLVAITYPRSLCYAPLKNASGSNSPEKVRAKLFERDRLQYLAIFHKPPPEGLFELPQAFYYPKGELLEDMIYTKETL